MVVILQTAASTNPGEGSPEDVAAYTTLGLNQFQDSE